MDLEEILKSIIIDPKDEAGGADLAFHHLRTVNDSFVNDSNRVNKLKEFIEDTLKEHKHEIEYLKKYTNTLFQENTWRSLVFEDKIYKQVLDNLSN